MTPRRIPWLALFAALLAGCAAPDSARESSSAQTAWKIPPSADFLARMPPPPPVGSPELRRQIAEILALQSAATPGRIAQARWTYDFSVFTFSVALGPDFTAKHYPQTAAFFLELNNLVERVNDTLKDHFRAPHPFQVDARIKRFVDAVPGYDYPSYHAARCAVFQRVLADLDPTRAAAFDRVALMVESDRVFAGEHFPFSIAAGRRLGAAIYAALCRDPRFRADLHRLAEAEWTPSPPHRNSF